MLWSFKSSKKNALSAGEKGHPYNYKHLSHLPDDPSAGIGSFLRVNAG
jgi:hypothetical protein